MSRELTPHRANQRHHSTKPKLLLWLLSRSLLPPERMRCAYAAHLGCCCRPNAKYCLIRFDAPLLEQHPHRAVHHHLLNGVRDGLGIRRVLWHRHGKLAGVLAKRLI